MQFKVPQNIDMEDKIVGPLTMKQFIYLLVGGMITYASIKSYNMILILFIGLPVGLITLCLTFVKIQDQPFSKFLLSLIYFIIIPSRRVWQKDRISDEKKQSIVVADVKKKEMVNQKIVTRTDLEKLSQILDKQGKIEYNLNQQNQLKNNNKVS